MKRSEGSREGNKTDNNKFGDTLLWLRKKNKMSQEEVGNYIGVIKSTISKYELGQCMPSIEKASLLAECLGVSLNELVGDTSLLDDPITEKDLKDLIGLPKSYIKAVRLAFNNEISAEKLVDLVNAAASIKKE